jgi:acyl-CoA reductase-like NAD-dependent aldehyde dehydrogenase
MTLQPPRTVDLFVSGRWQPPRAGQYESATGCTAAERILVHEQVHDAFVEALAAAVGKEVVLGDPFDPDRRAVRPGLAAALGQRQRVVPAPSDE